MARIVLFLVSMRTRHAILGLLITIALLEGCASVLVGGLIWKSSKSKEEKNMFLRDFNQLNLEREKAGLKPLNKCIEMYHFDPGWARESADCRVMIDSLVAAGVQPDTTRVSRK